MTDRQTDRQTDRHCHWAITSFDEEEILRLDCSGTRHPGFVKKVNGGVEICKETGRRHFQGHVHTTQSRFRALKRWLPKAHIEVARDVRASINYAMKSDTTEGAKQAYINVGYMTDRKLMELVADQCDMLCDCKGHQGLYCVDEREDYWHRVRRILLTQPDLCGALAKPDIYRLWKHTKTVWFSLKKMRDSITPHFNEIIIPCMNIHEGQVSERNGEEERGGGAQAHGATGFS